MASESTTASDIVDKLVFERKAIPDDPLNGYRRDSEWTQINACKSATERLAYNLTPLQGGTPFLDHLEPLAELCESLTKSTKGWLDNEYRRQNNQGRKVRNGEFDFETAAEFRARISGGDSKKSGGGDKDEDEDSDAEHKDENKDVTKKARRRRRVVADSDSDSDSDSDGNDEDFDPGSDVETGDKVANAVEFLRSNENRHHSDSVKKEKEETQTTEGLRSGNNRLLDKGLKTTKAGALQSLESNERSSKHAIPAEQLLPEMQKKHPNFRLYPHQADGVGRMRHMEETRHAWLLGDDMGLGKTVQVIALIEDDLTRNPGKTTLLVAPLGLVRYWLDEFARLTPSLRVLRYIAKDAKDMRKRAMLEFDVIVTNYEVVMGQWNLLEETLDDWDKIRLGLKSKEAGSKKRRKTQKPLKDHRVDAPLYGIRFHRVVLEEAHRIRARERKTSLAVAELDSLNRGCITGTPFQNDYSDFFSVARFLHLKPWHKWQLFESCFMKKTKGENSTAAAQLDRDMENALACIRTGITIRREKGQKFDGKPVGSASNPEERWIVVLLGPHNQEIVNEKRDLFDPVYRMTVHENKASGTGPQPRDRKQLFSELIEAQLEAINPCLLLPGYGDLGEEDVAEPDDEDEEESNSTKRNTMKDRGDLAEKYNQPRFESMETGKARRDEFIKFVKKENTQGSEFINAASDLVVEKIEEEEMRLQQFTDPLERKRQAAYGKILVFCSYLCALDLMKIELAKRRVKVYELNGHCTGPERDAILNNFEERPQGIEKDFTAGDEPDKTRVMLASTRIAAEGFNLVHACHVILLGVEWNPFLERHAISRIDRLGQPREVYIYHVYTANSIHERVKRTQNKKLKKVTGVMDTFRVQESAPEILRWNRGILKSKIDKKAGEVLDAMEFEEEDSRSGGED